MLNALAFAEKVLTEGIPASGGSSAVTADELRAVVGDVNAAKLLAAIAAANAVENSE